MADFYSLLAQYYDALFPAEPETVDFLAAELDARAEAKPEMPGRAGSSDREGMVVDVACGTGNYTDALVGRGFDCVGFDASELMVERAREAGKRGRFAVADMRALGTSLRSVTGGEGSVVDGLFCIGNSLPHMPNRATVRRFFSEAADVLPGGGTIVVQVVNFLRFRNAELPPIERPEVTMRRRYRPASSSEKVVFEMEIRPRGAAPVRAETELLALSPGELKAAAAEAGFCSLGLWGSYGRAPYDPEESFPVILTGRRAPGG
ncbi:MAG: class I SAM-dependent DNA methyltransferase, partial [Spirochaetaceae bacterium]